MNKTQIILSIVLIILLTGMTCLLIWSQEGHKNPSSDTTFPKIYLNGTLLKITGYLTSIKRRHPQQWNIKGRIKLGDLWWAPGYDDRRSLVEGHMRTVMYAYSKSGDRYVAKILSLAKTPLTNILHEIKIQQKLGDNGLAPVIYEAVRTNDLAVILMDRLDCTLWSHMREIDNRVFSTHPTLSPKEASYLLATLATEISSIIREMHQLGIVHGDLHALNIMRSRSGTWQFIDLAGGKENGKVFGSRQMSRSDSSFQEYAKKDYERMMHSFREFSRRYTQKLEDAKKAGNEKEIKIATVRGHEAKKIEEASQAILKDASTSKSPKYLSSFRPYYSPCSHVVPRLGP